MILIGDEWARLPAYLPRVRAVFRNLCSRPNLGCRPLAWPSPATLSALLPAGGGHPRRPGAASTCAPSWPGHGARAAARAPGGGADRDLQPARPAAQAARAARLRPVLRRQRGPLARTPRPAEGRRDAEGLATRRCCATWIASAASPGSVDVRITEGWTSAASDPGDYSRAHGRWPWSRAGDDRDLASSSAEVRLHRGHRLRPAELVLRAGAGWRHWDELEKNVTPLLADPAPLRACIERR